MTRLALLVAIGMLGIAPASEAGPAAGSLASLPGSPDVRSAAVLIVDEANSSVLYQRQAAIAAPIASITKLMTALVVLDAHQPLDELITVSKEDTNSVKGAHSRLPIGAKVSRGDLLHVALMSSENRAAHALGRSFPGGISAFVAAMNAKAKSLSMHTAHFVDPTGLSGLNVASAYDLAELVVAASKNATIREFSTDRSHSIPIGRSQLAFHNTNPLVSSPDWQIVVQKTGYLNEAGRCLVLKTVIEGREMVIVLLDSFGKYTRTADARRIRRWIESAVNAAPASTVASAPNSGS